MQPRKKGDVTSAESSFQRGAKLGGTWAPQFSANLRWLRYHFRTRKFGPSFVWSFSHSWGFKDFERIPIISLEKMLQLILQFEMGAKLSNFLAPGFHFSCALLFFVVMIVMSSHDGVHRYFSMSAITCLNKSYLWNCLMDSRIGSRWTMGGWCFDDRLPKVFSMFFSPSMNGQFTLQLKQTNCQFFEFCNTWAMTTSVVKNHSKANILCSSFLCGCSYPAAI